MDRRLAIGMLGAAAAGVLGSDTAAKAEATHADDPIADRLTGRRVVIFAGDRNFTATVDAVVGSVLLLSDVKAEGGPTAKEAVVELKACQLVLLEGEVHNA